MGAGKTTVGKKLAKKLSLPFLDTDQLLEERTGVPVSQIFEIEGEQRFRDRERKLFLEISNGKKSVISTGGGLVLDAENRRAMKSSGEVVYLKANLRILWNRLRNCTTRPLLQTENPKESIKMLLIQRDPVYSELANYVFEVDSNSANHTAQKILQTLTGKHTGCNA